MNSADFWNGFEKRAKLGIVDLENHMGLHLDQKYEPQVEKGLDEAHSKSFALRHPWVTGIPTLGIWPLAARENALEKIHHDLMRRNPDLRKAVEKDREAQHKREVELMARDIAVREAEARENMTATGAATALAGLESYLRNRPERGRDEDES